jgi:hypothetical protein
MLAGRSLGAGEYESYEYCDEDLAGEYCCEEEDLAEEY